MDTSGCDKYDWARIQVNCLGESGFLDMYGQD